MKLFENVSGNQFRLLTESVLSESNNVREGLKKVFSSAGSEIPYSRLQNVGLGYIKDITEARKCALQEAKELALEFGYSNNEEEQKFVKENDFSKLSAENPEHKMAQRSSAEDHSEHDMSNPEESREVQIGLGIKKSVKTLRDLLINKGYSKSLNDPEIIKTIDSINDFATHLVSLHTQ